MFDWFTGEDTSDIGIDYGDTGTGAVQSWDDFVSRESGYERQAAQWNDFVTPAPEVDQAALGRLIVAQTSAQVSAEEAARAASAPWLFSAGESLGSVAQAANRFAPTVARLFQDSGVDRSQQVLRPGAPGLVGVPTKPVSATPTSVDVLLTGSHLPAIMLTGALIALGVYVIRAARA